MPILDSTCEPISSIGLFDTGCVFDAVIASTDGFSKRINRELRQHVEATSGGHNPLYRGCMVNPNLIAISARNGPCWQGSPLHWVG